LTSIHQDSLVIKRRTRTRVEKNLQQEFFSQMSKNRKQHKSVILELKKILNDLIST